MSDALYTVTDERLEGVPGGRIDVFHINEQNARIFFGDLRFSDVSGEITSISWRASYTGPTTGYTIHERSKFLEKLHALPNVNVALKRFISGHIIIFRELPQQSTPTTDKGNVNVPRDTAELPPCTGITESEVPVVAPPANITQPVPTEDEPPPPSGARRSTVEKPVLRVRIQRTDKDRKPSAPDPKAEPTGCVEGEEQSSVTKPSETGKDAIDASSPQQLPQPSIAEKAAIFAMLPKSRQIVAGYLARNCEEDEIAKALTLSSGTVHTYVCTLRKKLSAENLPELRETVRELFRFDASLQPASEELPREIKKLSTDIATGEKADMAQVPFELFGKEALGSCLPRDRAVACLLTQGLAVSQIASKLNLRSSEVGHCKSKLQRLLSCLDDAALLLRLKAIAEGKETEVLEQTGGRVGVAEAHKDAHVSGAPPAESENELLPFAGMMATVEAFRARLTTGYELSIGDIVVVPGGNVVSVSIRVKQVR